LQSANALTLDVSGNLDNQSGKVIAQNGDVSVNAANIDNRGGILSSIKGALEARTVGVLRNGYDLNNNRQGGIIQAQGLKLTALAGWTTTADASPRKRQTRTSPPPDSITASVCFMPKVW
jgi:filamentous hemagglutinin